VQFDWSLHIRVADQNDDSLGISRTRERKKILTESELGPTYGISLTFSMHFKNMTTGKKLATICFILHPE